MPRKRIAIIGGGASGLAAIKTCLEEGRKIHYLSYSIYPVDTGPFEQCLYHFLPMLSKPQHVTIHIFDGIGRIAIL